MARYARLVHTYMNMYALRATQRSPVNLCCVLQNALGLRHRCLLALAKFHEACCQAVDAAASGVPLVLLVLRQERQRLAALGALVAFPTLAIAVPTAVPPEVSAIVAVAATEGGEVLLLALRLRRRYR